MKHVLVFDLDDTLTKEIDYLRSGYRMVAELVHERFGLDGNEVYTKMLAWYKEDENAFERLNQEYGLDNPIADYLNIYRFHKPSLVISDDVCKTLDFLKSEGVALGIVSDGREITQMNKVKALGLTKWIDESCIIINSEKQHFKPNPSGYERLLAAIRAKYGDEQLEYTYVGDNLKKDFIWPNANGWNTICLKDDGRNIHKQDFEAASGDALPKKVIVSLKELL